MAAAIAVTATLAVLGGRIGHTHRVQLQGDSPLNLLLMLLSVAVGSLLGVIAAALAVSTLLLVGIARKARREQSDD